MELVSDATCQGCGKSVPAQLVERSVEERKNLRCTCGVPRLWKSLIAKPEPMAAPQPLTRPSNDAPIKHAKAYIESRLMEGVSCPCCGRNNKRYTRPLDAGIARGLVALVRASPKGEVVHVKDIPEMLVGDVAWTSHDFAKARYWGLCEEVSGSKVPQEILANKPGRKRKKGFWRSTDLGRKFVYSMAPVPKYITLVNNVFEMTLGEEWWIHDALGEPFDYYKITNTIRPSETVG